jgi:hypothetical protein
MRIDIYFALCLGVTWAECGDSNVVLLFAHLLAPAFQQPGHGILARSIEPGTFSILASGIQKVRTFLWLLPTAWLRWAELGDRKRN